MNFKVNRIILLNSLSKVSKAVSYKTPLPALTGIKFDLYPTFLQLTASEQNIAIQVKIEADNNLEIIDTGSVVLSAKYILEIIRKLDSNIVEFEIIDGFLTRISGGNSEFNLNGTDPMDYPQIDLIPKGMPFIMDSIELKELINDTRFAASEKENRPILTGINLIAKDNELVAIGTNSYRLSKKSVKIDSDITFDITIPAKSLDDISKIIENQDNVNIYVSERSVIFIFENNIILTRLIDGSFPDVSSLIPTQFAHELTIDSSLISNSISRVSLLTNEQNNVIKLDMNNDRVILSSFMQEIGSVEDTITECFYKGEPLSITFDNKYISDAIKVLDKGKIKLCFPGEMRPFILKMAEDDSLIELILPVRTHSY